MRLGRADLFTILCLFMLAICPLATTHAAEEEGEEPPKILGRCSVDDLEREPFGEWFRSGNEEYVPNPDVLARLRDADLAGLEVSIFFGTWCGDSRREVPRLVKLFEEMELPEEDLHLIAVDGEEEAHKQSPDREERGLEIYRVPTVIVRRGGKEVNRLVEHPVLSLERDVLEILDGNGYVPSYGSYPTVRRWLNDGLLADENVSPRGLAEQVRSVVSGEGELAAAAYVLMTRGDVTEAVKLYQVNCALYRDSSRSYSRLAKAWLAAEEPEKAREAAERALRLNTDEKRLESLLELLDQTRS